MSECVIGSVEIQVLGAVDEACCETDDHLVTSYDIQYKLANLNFTTRFLGQSMLPPMSRRGLLEQIKRPCCPPMYRLTKLGRLALEQRMGKDGLVRFETDLIA